MFGKLDKIVFLLMGLTLCIACKKEKSYSTIPQDAMLMMHIEQQQGDNMDPFTQTEMDFIGFPGAIGYTKEMPSLPFLIVGKNLHKKNKHMSHFIGTVTLQLGEKRRYLGIAMPVNDKFKTVSVDSYQDFSAEHANVKLWLTDWITFSYRDKGLQTLTWNNEIEVLRKFVTTNN